MAKLTMKMVVTVQARLIIYKVVVQTVLLYRSKIWVLIDVILKVLERFHHRVAWRMAGILDW